LVAGALAVEISPPRSIPPSLLYLNKITYIGGGCVFRLYAVDYFSARGSPTANRTDQKGEKEEESRIKKNRRSRSG